MDRRTYLAAVALGLGPLAGCQDSPGPSTPTRESMEAPTSEPTEASTSTPEPTPMSSPTPRPSPTPEPTPEGSVFQGPVTENRQYVELQYRDYVPREVDRIRSDAESIDYRTLFRDIESYVGQAVIYEGVVGQTLEGESHFIFLIFLNDDVNQAIYASWTGGRFLQEDQVRIWGEVLGTEIYRSAAGSENTVPAIAIADMELLNSG